MSEYGESFAVRIALHPLIHLKLSPDHHPLVSCLLPARELTQLSGCRCCAAKRKETLLELFTGATSDFETAA